MTRRIHVHGPGRAGTSLAVLLARSGWSISSLSGGSEAGAREAAALLGGAPWTPEAPTELVPETLVLLGVPDDRTQAAVADLRGRLPPGVLVVHLAGFTPLSVLDPLLTRGVRTGALHALHAFAARDPGSQDLRGALVAVEARTPADQELLMAAARDAGGVPFSIDSARRPLYHLGASVLANGLVALAALALEALTLAGVPSGMVLPALCTLGESSLANIARLGPAAALTGPVVRGDVATVRQHLEALTRELPGSAPLYRELVRALVAVARDRAGGARVAAVERWLEETEP